MPRRTTESMKYLILSDIHSNKEALSAALSFVRRKPWDKAVCLGDIVGYGANPNQAVDMVKRDLVPGVEFEGPKFRWGALEPVMGPADVLGLSEEQVIHALSYYFDHPGEIDALMEAEAAAHERYLSQ